MQMYGTKQMLCGLAVATALAPIAHGQVIFEDDFSSGNDNKWIRVDDIGGSTFDASSGRYEMTTVELPPLSGMVGIGSEIRDSRFNPESYTDGRYRVTVRFENDTTNVFVAGRLDGTKGYVFVLNNVNPDPFFGIGHFNEPRVAASVPMSFDVGVDYNVEASMFGDQFGMKVWEAGHPEPLAPQVTWEDGLYTSGMAGMGVYNQPSGMGGTGGALAASFDDVTFAVDALQPHYSTDFSQGDAGWTHYEPLEPFGAGGTYTFPSTGGYRMQAPPSPDPSTLGNSRVGSIAPPVAGSTSDFLVSADLIDFTLTGERMVAGIGFHGSDPGLGTTNGYALWAFLNPATNGTTLRFNVFTNEEATAIGSRETIPGVNPLRLIVRGVGNTFTGQAWDLDTGELLAEVTATDSTHGPGGTSLIIGGAGGSNPTNPQLDATWTNFSIESTDPPCIADWNGDGEVDINDLFEYLSDFEDGLPRADLNLDGEIDINDFFLFLQEFEKGC